MKNWWYWLRGLLLLRLQDVYLGRDLDMMLVDWNRTAAHDLKHLNSGEELQILSLTLLKTILKYHLEYTKTHDHPSIGTHMLGELKAYVALREKPRDYLKWCLKKGFVHKYGRLSLEY